TLSSEIIESFGIDGDIANSIAGLLLKLKTSTIVTIGAIGGVVAGAIGAAASVIDFARAAAEAADEIDSLQQKTGLSAETLSTFRVVAEENDMTLTKLGGSFTTLQEKLSDAERGNKRLVRVFRELGIDVRGTTDDALAKIIQKFNELPDG